MKKNNKKKVYYVIFAHEFRVSVHMTVMNIRFPVTHRYDSKAYNFFFHLIAAQKELLDRAYANGQATQGKYNSAINTAAAGEDNFVAQHVY